MMKSLRNCFLFATTAGLLLTSAAGAAPRIYQWVMDKNVSSLSELKTTQATRVIALDESRTLELIRQVLTDDLFLTLAEYHKTRHQQDAETTVDSVLPEDIVGQTDVELADKDFRFILKIRLKAVGPRTRVTAVAHPMYRIRDFEAEDEANPETGESTVEVKISGGHNQAVGVGPIFVAPMAGLPSDYNVLPLPDAGQRSAQLVRSFMLKLDQRIKGAAETSR